MKYQITITVSVETTFDQLYRYTDSLRHAAREAMRRLHLDGEPELRIEPQEQSHEE